MTSEEILDNLIKTLEAEIAQQEKQLQDLNFAIKVKKSKLKKLKGDSISKS